MLIQSIRPKYHFFVDCDSKDNTLNIIDKYKKNNKEISVICLKQISTGIYSAWNQGLVNLLELIKEEEFVCILNSDDWLEEDYISKITCFSDYDLVAGSCQVHYEKNSFIRPCRNLKLLPIFMSIIDPSLFIKASVFREIGIYRERYQVAADHDFVFRAYEMGCRFKILNDVLVNVKMGGFASQNKKIAFIEQLELSRERCMLPIPELAYIYRIFKFPRFRFFDFL